MRADVVIYNLLKNDSSVAALTTQIFPNVVPKNVSLELVLTYTVFQTNPVKTNAMDINTDFALVQISCFGRSYDNVQTLADAVIHALNAKSGTISIGGNNYNYKNIRFDDRNDLGYDETNEVFMIALDFSVQMYI